MWYVDAPHTIYHIPKYTKVGIWYVVCDLKKATYRIPYTIFRLEMSASDGAAAVTALVTFATSSRAGASSSLAASADATASAAVGAASAAASAAAAVAGENARAAVRHRDEN